MRKLMLRLRENESGAAMAEYAILIAVIALVAIVGAQTFGDKLSTQFNNVADQLK